MIKSGKVTLEQMAEIGTRPSGKMHPFRMLILQLEVGEVAFLARAEWRWKHQTPRVFVREVMNSQRGRKYTLMQANGRIGWFVKREA